MSEWKNCFRCVATRSAYYYYIPSNRRCLSISSWAAHHSTSLFHSFTTTPQPINDLQLENAVPGAYSQTCMNLDERSFRLKSSGDTVTVYQGTSAGGGMAGRTGGMIFICVCKIASAAYIFLILCNNAFHFCPRK